MLQNPPSTAEECRKTESAPTRRPRIGLASALARLAQTATPLEVVLPAIGEFLRNDAGCDGFYSVKSLAGRGALRLEQVDPSDSEPTPVERAELLLLAQKALSTKSGVTIVSVHSGNRILAAVPIASSLDRKSASTPRNDGSTATPDLEQCVALVGVRRRSEPGASQPDLLTALELVVASFPSRSDDKDRDSTGEIRSAATLVELLTSALRQPTLEQTFACVADTVRSYLECKAVWLATARPGTSCEVVAVSGVSPDRESEPFAAHVAALNEAILRDQMTRWPAVEPGDRWGCLAQQRALGSSDAAAILSAPLRDSRGTVVGGWLLTGSRERLSDPQFLSWVSAAEESVATILETSQRVHQSAWQRLRARLPQGGWKTPRRIAAVCLAASALLMVPAPHRVACDCELQPVVRRFVTVPFAGRLDHSLVKPGDLVSTGDVLARLDGRELELELAATGAELHGAAKRRDGELAEHDFGAAHLSRFEVERLEARSNLLRTRTEQLQIRSPIDGVVVSGDLERMDGAAFKVGQSLYEIASLRHMTVEIAIPEEDIAFVHPEMPLTIRLEAGPSESIEGRLVRVHPRSEIRHEQNVFIGEMEVENTSGGLRPGMRGTARIAVGWRTCGWIWFHKAWERCLSFW